MGPLPLCFETPRSSIILYLVCGNGTLGVIEGQYEQPYAMILHGSFLSSAFGFRAAAVAEPGFKSSVFSNFNYIKIFLLQPEHLDIP